MKRQRGALTVITPLIILLVVMFSALALDGARLYAMRGQMQSIANAAATAAADAAQACGGGPITLADIQSSADSAARAQGMDDLGGQLNIQAGVVETGVNNTLGFRPTISRISESNAVRVEYTLPDTPISRLMPGLLGSVDLGVTAVAKKEVIATISAAGSTAVVGGAGGNAGLLGTLLGGLLGVSDFALDATSVESLANTTFQLGEFLKSTGVASGLTAVDDLVGADRILRGVLAGLDPASDAAGVIQNLLADTGLVTTNVRLDEVIKLVTDVQYPDETPVPVYDTVVALALNLLDGVTTIPVDADINLANLIGADLSLTVDNPPTVVVGPARTDANGVPLVEFEAADITLALLVEVRLLELATVEIPLAVETGGGTGYLEYADCASGSSNDVVFTLNMHPKVASVSTGIINAAGDLEVQGIRAEVLPLLKDVLASIVVEATIANLQIGSSASSSETIGYNLYERQSSSVSVGGGTDIYLDGGDFDILKVTVETNEEDCGLLGLGCVLDKILEPILGVVTGAVNEILQSGIVDLVGSILSTVLEPLLNALGLHLGGMTVSVTSADQGVITLLDCGTGACDLIPDGS
ncbi:pilus assembly protein TadG-related protein [Alcanivoracaceae bacterium MT1]